MPDQPTSGAPAQPRVIRVFISSTFRDMHAEREELVKRIFPQLRKLCESRGVTWGEVDLRWGVTDEQKAEGQVLPICLAEIQRCRPYFIGLLGERYGWVPEVIPPELIEQEGWLADHRERSVTELEILHGVLNNPAMADHALFYFRDPAYEDRPPDLCETPTSEETARLGPESAEQQAAERRRKLAALKARIRRSGLPIRENYPNPQALGELVLQDLTAIINRLYPEGAPRDPLDREAAEHEALAVSRAGVYIGRREYYDHLDAHAASDGPPLVVLGESGSGKSALLANWALRYRTQYPDDFVLMHFIGASPYSADWAAMLRRIMGEFKRRFGLEQEIPDKPDALRLAFANALHMAAARGRVVVILDALNQLEDRDAAPDLVWLPPEIPGNIRLILSTIAGRPLEDLKKRDWPTLRVEPLLPEERIHLITEYLRQYSRALSPDRVSRIATAPPTASPLYLRALLEELRLFGVHEALAQRIEHYLAAPTVEGLYEKILERYEQDYERDRPCLVRDAMTLLWAARRGLSETELLELLGSDGNPLPRAYWSPLFLVAEHSLVSRSGLIGFFHDYLREAVRSRYLPAAAAEQAAHHWLAVYFAGQPLGPRQVDELPWQLSEAGAWSLLYNLLADLPFFYVAWHADQFEVQGYWAQLERKSALRKIDAYRPVLDYPNRVPEKRYIWDVAALLGRTGHPVEAQELFEYLVRHYRQEQDRAKLLILLGNLAQSFMQRGYLDRAMELLKEDEALCRKLDDKRHLSNSLRGQAIILRDLGDLKMAMALLNESELLCEEVGDSQGLAYTLINQALIQRDQGDLQAAMALLKRQEKLCREQGDRHGLHTSLNQQALILYTLGSFDDAMTLHKEQERICREIGDKYWLSVCLGNQARIPYARGDMSEAMALHKEEEQLCRELGDKEGLSHCLCNQGLILMGWGDLGRAFQLFREQEQLAREIGYKHGLSISLGKQALIISKQGDLDGALLLHKEQERLCRELGDQEELSVSLRNQALIFQSQGDLNPAMTLIRESERICREMSNKSELSHSLNIKALILRSQGDYGGAMTCHKEQERLCRELGYKNGLSDSLGNQALIFVARGELDEAMALFREVEQFCRELGNLEGLAISLATQAGLLSEKMGRPREALPLADEAEALVKRHGLTRVAGQIQPIVDAVRAKAR